MILRKLKKLIFKVMMSTLVILTVLVPGNTRATERKIMLDLAHNDTCYYLDGILIRDNGASYQGYNEREITNEISLKVKTKLEERGYKVDLTRGIDEPMTLSERVEKSKGYDMYISLHANSANQIATGTEAYSNNLWSLSNNICNDISTRFNIPHRGVKATPFYNINIPNSSIIELGFMNGDLNMLINHKDELADIVADNIDKQYSVVQTSNYMDFSIKRLL